MAFNFGGFLMGASQQLVKEIERKEEELREDELLKEERDWQESLIKKRAAASAGAAEASERRKRNNDIADLTSRAAFHYGTDNAAAMAKQGFGYLTEAVTIGNQLSAAGYNPSTFYTASNGTLDAAKKVVTQTEGQQVQAAVPTTSIPDAPVPVGGFDFDAIRTALKPDKTASSLDALLAMNTQDILKANEDGDATALDVALKNQSAILKTIALAEDPEAVEQISEDPRMLLANMRAQAIGNYGASSGEMGQLAEEVKGAPYFGDLMDYVAGDRMLNYVSEFDPKQVSNVTNVAKGTMKAAERNLLNYASDVAAEFMSTEDAFAKGKVKKGGVVDGRDDVRYGRVTSLPSIEKTGNLLLQTIDKPKDAGVVILQDKDNNIRIALYTGIPNPKLGGAPYLVSDY
jgi:hypothetical protein